MTQKTLQRAINSYCSWCLNGNKKDTCTVTDCPFYNTQNKKEKDLMIAIYERCIDCSDEADKCNQKDCKVYRQNRMLIHLSSLYSGRQISHRLFFTPTFKKRFLNPLKIKGKKRRFCTAPIFSPKKGKDTGGG